MTEEERLQIKKLRTEGYSYGRIAKILGISRDTISSYCRRKQITILETRANPNEPLQYRQCLYCHQLFLANSLKNQIFCTTECRRRYGSREEQGLKTIESQSLYIETLRKELDLFAEESDELVGEEAIHLCRKKETTL